ncbi:WD repeat and FYVE domain-containing protein 3-like isoform X1 [Mytilus californianus]|uniref:WD repeat and FYVE domain-containing protein 3-like isoform X1 n=1 Tax=Mytilus californianus TaxID=6549 RepID=UPI00224563C1|nr:WD repeat and FYVE domain-containing protein 3-like isoform X1 [Mytilus californianus]
MSNFLKKMMPGKHTDMSLGLNHLRKLFAEFRHPNRRASQDEQEEKLYTMIPLFCKTFGEVPSSEMMEKFGDILQFSSHLSKLMVTEIRRRASNQSTEAASCAIVRFLEINSSEEASNGWMLLQALTLLSSGGQALIDNMTGASLPSTLVKCLYLFFDLPEILDGDAVEPGCNFTHTERRILLQKVFVQVLVRLCNYASPAEELAKKDDLSLLFSAITSWCPAHNVVWRKSAGEVLVTLSRHGLIPNVVKYIHDKGCVRHCIENMQRIQELSPIEQVEMFVTVFCFLKDSSEVSQVLMEDFKSCQGYNYLCEFLLRLELDTCLESTQALRNLLLLVGSLTTCGYMELKPNQASSGSLYQMPGFSLPQPAGKGVSVRNIQAFQVLQSVFMKGSTSCLCNTILEVINSIYHQDNANYFILEPQHTMSQFVEKIYLKPQDVQEKFFELLEFIVYDLNFVPCKELISISILIKSDHSTQCNILCMKSLLKILQTHTLYKDVFREVGMLEVMVTCLHRYAALLKTPDNDTVELEPIAADQQELGSLVMECLTALLSGNSKNADVFRECGGARCAHTMIPHMQCRQQTLNIVQQLVLSPGGDDDMGTLLGLMHSSPVLSLQLKTHILKALLNVLRESHRSRTVFRRVGGFVYVMSVLVSMEGCLCDPPKVPWDQVRRTDVLSMLKTVFSTLTVAMRYEPANAKFFETEVRYDSLTEAVRLLGCFSSTIDIQPSGEVTEAEEQKMLFEDVFVNTKESKGYDDIPMTLLSACVMLKYLYNMAQDIFDKPTSSQAKTDSPSLKRLTMFKESSTSPQSSPKQKRASTGSIPEASHVSADQIIVHPGAVLSLFHLLPAIEHDDDKKPALALQINTAELLKSLLHTERNQQIMCEYGYPHELLSHGYIALADETHPLHPSLRSMFERLASQSLTPRDLRDFLRLGSPLNCRPMDNDYDIGSNNWSCNWPISRASSVEERKTPVEVERKLKTAGEAVPLTRVKCLVSMTTPKDARMHGSAVTPSFVEFDMTAEGFGCLYLPSIAPQGPPTPSVVSGVVGGNDPVVIGGIGTGERVFPPQAGMTFSTWFCVDKFSSRSDPHPVRLLTLVRNLQGREENLICLSVILTSREKALIVSTEEHLLPNTVTGSEIDEELSLNDNRVRFWYPELTQEGQWHHLVLIFHRAGIMKNSSVGLFVDGDHVNTQKLHYVSPNLGVGGTASPTAFTSVFAYIGSPPQVRRNSRLTWRQGPCHLMEDIVSSNVIKNIYNLGPIYIGSFQAPNMDEVDFQGPYINEEKVMYGVHAHTVLQMTVSKIRKAYNKIDSKSIAKQLAMSAHDNATPIRILPNSAGHMNGPARSLGAILIGYLGVRTFCPKAVAKMLENVGGASALLGLIAMATDVEELYAAVKALVCVVKSNKNILKDMDRIQGYQTLSMLYKKKQHLLNSHILHLTFSLIGTVDSGKESSVIPNKKAFEDLLCDLEVWHEAPFDLQKSLYEHFFELLTESSEQISNFQLMRDIGLVSRLLHILKDNKLTQASIDTITSVIHVLLQSPPDHHSLLRFGQFIVSTLPQMSNSEKNLALNGLKVPAEETQEDSISISDDEQVSSYTIKLRNICLDVIHKLILNTEVEPVQLNTQMSDEIQKVLGFDWLLLFMQGHIHPSTVVKASLILLTMLQSQSATAKFREGSLGGGWLKGTEPVLKQHVGVMLGLNIGTSNKGQKRALNREVCQVPGFTIVQWLLPKHANAAEIYFILMAMLLGQHIKELPSDVQLNLDQVWTVIFGVPASKPVSAIAKEKQAELCPDAALVLLALIRHMLNQESDQKCSTWLQEYPVTLMQFLLFLYHNQPDFISLSITSEFISGLVATLFPSTNVTTESKVTTPQEEYMPFPDADGYIHIKTPDPSHASALSEHPARKFVIDFLRTIILDSFSQQSSPKPVLDVVLDASPDNANRQQRHEFQTEIMKTIMEHLVAADVLLGEQAALPIATGGSYVSMANNVFYFASRVVDKLWQSVFMRESKEVFEFISKLIAQAKRKASGVSLDLIYKSLNRTILYQLSRPLTNVASSTGVLDALHKLTSNRSLVFGPNNYDTEFLVCLCYCLLQLTEDPEKGSSNLHGGQAMTTTWHVNLGEEDPYNDFVIEGSAVPEGHLLVCKASKRVWEELYAHKKPSLEEVFKTQLNNIDSMSTDFTSPDLNTVRGLIQESASKVWVQYVENERKCNFSYTDRIPAQIQSKIAKMGNAVLKFSVRKNKKDLPLKSSPSSTVHMTDYISWTLTHMAVVRDLVQLQFQQYLQGHEHMERYLVEEWEQCENELLREKGLWGPYVGSRFDKWMLDVTEGPCRMRKKMVFNDLFYTHYPYRPDLENSPLKYKVAMCLDSREYYERYLPKTLIGLGNEILPIQIGTNVGSGSEDSAEERSPEDILPKLVPRKTDQKSTDLDEDIEEIITTDNNTETDKADGPSEGQGDQTDGKSDNQTDVQTNSRSDNNQAIFRILGEGEKITNIFRCARIQGLDTAEGLLLFGKEYFYIIDGLTMLKSREIRDIDSLPLDLHDPIIPSKGSCSHKRTNSKFAYDDIKEVHKRRYLLQPIAVEVFSSDGRNYLLAFPRKLRNKVYAKFLSVANEMTDNAQQSVSGQKVGAKIEASSGLISSFIGEKSVTQRWERGEINNFQYLMHLNTLAGRSYNDLMQYPVFPWVVADYDSEELDLYSETTFRDLAKPMGAQTPNRLAQFRKRYTDWDDPQGETPPYHYGTHYSSAMIVASYLVRMEPFTQHFLKLQGGHFDLADRMFHSIKEGWCSASKNNMADVKELIPEFFYLPEFLGNSNNFDLGMKQSGVQLDNVMLPKWAKEDAREYIRAHREALECDYVSAHLHEWIDLIFGCKQQGQAAVDAVNVFHHLFYEGNVDIYNIDDPLKKHATIGFINNFGQIPKQLFKKPHPQKKLALRLGDAIPMGPLPPNANDKLFFHNVDNLRPTKQAIKELKGAVGQIFHHESKNVLAVEQNKVLIPPQYNKYLSWGFSDLSVRIGNYESEKALHVFENLDNGEILCASYPNAKTFITGGTSTVVNVWELKPKSKKVCLKQPLYGHTETVTCLASSQAYNVIVSGSRDRTCIIWDLSRLVYVKQLRGHAAPVAAVCINELTGDIATCAGTYLYVWSINGEEIACVNTASLRSQQILCLAMSQILEWDNRNVILTGSGDGVVRMWSIEYVQVPVEERPSKDAQNDSSDTMTKGTGGDLTSPTSKLSRQVSCDSYGLQQNSAIERLQEFREPNLVDISSSLESESNMTKILGSKGKGRLPGNLDREESITSRTSSTSDFQYSRTGYGDDVIPDDTHSVKSADLSIDTAVEAYDEMVQSNISDTQLPSLSEPNLVSLAEGSGMDKSQSHPDLKTGELEKPDFGRSGSSEFEIISDKEARNSPKTVEDILKKYRPRTRHALREGFRWQRQLVFRNKLTMHTAFERKDNKDPASVTSIAISKDHKTVYVGDNKGRIFSWTVSDQPGRVVADHWMKDEVADACQCGVKFSFSDRRHHCRDCGNVFCAKCTRYETEIRRRMILRPVRVCKECYKSIKGDKS